MRKTILFVLFACPLLLQSCFEIIEQMIISNDGSGNFQLILNMSKSKTRLNSMMKMRTVNGHHVPDKAEINQRVEGMEKAIRNTDGISNLKTSLDFTNFIATFTCDFTKTASLNAAIKNVAENEGDHGAVIENNFQYNSETGIFSRTNYFPVKKAYDKMSNADKEVFSTANYTGIFRFDNDIASAANKDSRISANKKAVMLKLNALDIISNKKTIDNKIKLVK